MGIIKVEISLPQAIRSITQFKENRLRALETFTSEVRRSAAQAINQLLQTEMTLFLGGEDQSDNKKNGYTEKDYTLKGLGTIRVKVPQDRRSRFNSSIIPKSEVIDPRLKEDLAVLHLAGLSTRMLSTISKRILGIDISTDTVSSSLGSIEERALEWLRRPITKKYWALYVDGTNFKIQRRGSTSAEPSLVVLGIDENNHRSILAIEPGFKDNVATWEAVFNSLIERGLDVSAVQLGIMDGLPGLENLFKRVFPNAVTQRCWAHSIRNAMGRIPERMAVAFKLLAHKVMYAASKEEAFKAMQDLKVTMGSDGRHAVHTLEKDIESLTAYYSFDKSLWRALRTTNPIERINRELKRRTKTMGTLGEKTLEVVVAFVSMKLEASWLRAPVNAPHFDQLEKTKKNVVEVTINRMFGESDKSMDAEVFKNIN